ncbi:uncharacterized protein LOC111133380 [Crassostrea virginica]
MALSKPIWSEESGDIQEIGQHYVECDTDGCNRNCQFYCNPCHRPMCEQCRDDHIKSPDTKSHEVVLYRQRIRQLPVVKCKDHPLKDIDMLCKECQVLVCSKCATRNHQSHELKDLEEIYSEKFTLCLEEIYKIHRYFIPTTHDLQEEIKKDTTELTRVVEDIRTSMKAEGERVKRLVDEVVSRNIEQVDKIEESLTAMLQSQDTTYNGYISDLNDRVKEFRDHQDSTDSLKLISMTEEKLATQPIPETTKPVLPVFTAGQYSKDDIAKRLGRVDIPTIKPKNRKIRPMENESAQLESTEEQMKQDREKSHAKQTLTLSSSVTKVREFKVPGLDDVYHVSLGKSGRIWASDGSGSLVQTDLKGNKLQNLKTSGNYEGYFTVTQEENLIYADKEKKVIKRITHDNKITEFIKTGDWKPLSVYSSSINGDILVGMITDGEAKVTRYSKTGNEVQNMQKDDKGELLFECPHYITENINGDICISDYIKCAVVVMNKSEKHRFSYRGQDVNFRPSGICTDVLGHIVVCDLKNFIPLYWSLPLHKVHLLNRDGNFLRLIFSPLELKFPISVCVDDENNLHVGTRQSNIVTVFKYLQ